MPRELIERSVLSSLDADMGRVCELIESCLVDKLTKCSTELPRAGSDPSISMELAQLAQRIAAGQATPANLARVSELTAQLR